MAAKEAELYEEENRPSEGDKEQKLPDDVLLIIGEAEIALKRRERDCEPIEYTIKEVNEEGDADKGRVGTKVRRDSAHDEQQ